jgi:hypothetical protein
MPNWCQNSLRAIGPKSEIHRLLEKAQGCGVDWPEDPAVAIGDCERRKLPLDFNQFVPVPEEIVAAGYRNDKGPKDVETSIQALEKESGIKAWDGYHSCMQNWDTKWSAGPDTEVDRASDCEVRFRFDTAWSPAKAVVVAMAGQSPLLKLKLEYQEPGGEFAGTLICEHGVVVLDECHHYWPFKDGQEEYDGPPAGISATPDAGS